MKVRYCSSTAYMRVARERAAGQPLPREPKGFWGRFTRWLFGG